MKVIETDQICVEGFEVTVYFKNPLGEKFSDEFKELITAWYTVGLYGGFTGYMHDLSALWTEEKEAGFTVDIGSAEQAALDTLILALEGFSETTGMIIEKVVLGSEIE